MGLILSGSDGHFDLDGSLGWFIVLTWYRRVVIRLNIETYVIDIPHGNKLLIHVLFYRDDQLEHIMKNIYTIFYKHIVNYANKTFNVQKRAQEPLKKKHKHGHKLWRPDLAM